MPKQVFILGDTVETCKIEGPLPWNQRSATAQNQVAYLICPWISGTANLWVLTNVARPWQTASVLYIPYRKWCLWTTALLPSVWQLRPRFCPCPRVWKTNIQEVMRWWNWYRSVLLLQEDRTQVPSFVSTSHGKSYFKKLWIGSKRWASSACQSHLKLSNSTCQWTSMFLKTINSQWHKPCNQQC